MGIINAEEKEKVWIVIAAYNEERRIEEVLTSLKEKGYENIVVVNDGSKDRTGIVAEKAGVYVLNHIINRGQGAALKTGMDFAIKNNAEIVVTFDADGQHHAEEIESLVRPILNKEISVALGSRFLGGKTNILWHRKLLLKGGALIIWFFYGIKLTDSHNGFRALTRGAIEKLELQTDKMEHASEIIEQIAAKRIVYRELPVTITYSEYSLEKGQSSTAAFGILWNMIKNKVLR